MSTPRASRQSDRERIELGGGRSIRLDKLVGEGGVSMVFRGVLESGSVRRVVALKAFTGRASEMSLLERTAARAACVRHPNVVEVLETGVWRSQPFFMTELVEGVSLQTLIDQSARKRRRVPLDLALFVATEVLDALAGAFAACDHLGAPIAMLHLGLSPRDVLLSTRGEVKVTDFEVALLRGSISSVRTLRGITERAKSMAPEVAHGETGDERSDVFAMGVLLRELVLGPRFAEDVTNADALRLAREGYVEPLSFRPHLPEALSAITTRALAIDPAERYPDARTMAEDLRRVSLSMGVGDARWFLAREFERVAREDELGEGE